MPRRRVSRQPRVIATVIPAITLTLATAAVITVRVDGGESSKSHAHTLAISTIGGAIGRTIVFREGSPVLFRGGTSILFRGGASVSIATAVSRRGIVNSRGGD